MEELAALISIQTSLNEMTEGLEGKKSPCDIRQLLFRKHRSQFRILFAIADKRIIILSIRHHSRWPLEDGDMAAMNYPASIDATPQ